MSGQRDGTARWVGGANVPTSHARIDATWPLGELVVRDRRVTVRLRRLVRWFGGVTLNAGTDDVQRVFPTRINLVSRVAIRHIDGREWYFWAGRSGNRAILAALRDAGFPTDDEFRPSKAWRGIP
jgi:hypothetical protein